jgi:hypothetical protein
MVPASTGAAGLGALAECADERVMGGAAGVWPGVEVPVRHTDHAGWQQLAVGEQDGDLATNSLPAP